MFTTVLHSELKQVILRETWLEKDRQSPEPLFINCLYGEWDFQCSKIISVKNKTNLWLFGIHQSMWKNHLSSVLWCMLLQSFITNFFKHSKVY